MSIKMVANPDACARNRRWKRSIDSANGRFRRPLTWLTASILLANGQPVTRWRWTVSLIALQSKISKHAPRWPRGSGDEPGRLLTRCLKPHRAGGIMQVKLVFPPHGAIGFNIHFAWKTFEFREQKEYFGIIGFLWKTAGKCFNNIVKWISY